MSRFALFYNKTDMRAIVDELRNNARLNGQEKTQADDLWNNGLVNWESAPVAPKTYQNMSTDYVHVYVIDSPTMTKQAMVDFLLKVARDKRNNTYYLESIANDIAVTAVEPWTG